ncbi:MAG: hypothetical protein B6U87_00575 [Candidatus Aenigmarchaeota archaeon ex4484_52]|nr:MAG: hypothetical protein B6U87_00575 [Candidatus Aenigmarchaeota archaeon ex4484_52]
MLKTNIIIGIIGVARSGKDTAANYISKKYDFDKFDFATEVLEPLLIKNKIKPTKKNKSNFAKNLRQKKGNDILAKLLFKSIKNKKSKNIVISGFRCIEEIDFFKTKTKKIIFLKLIVDEKTILKRGTYADIDRNKRDTTFIGMEKVLNYPSVKIQNNKTKQDLFESIDKSLSCLI